MNGLKKRVFEWLAARKAVATAATSQTVVQSSSADGSGTGDDADDSAGAPSDNTLPGVNAQLHPYQLRGVQWLLKRHALGVNVILADEMGLGKTLQTIAFIKQLHQLKRIDGAVLVLCPLSVVDGWKSEFKKFCPSLRIQVGCLVWLICPLPYKN